MKHGSLSEKGYEVTLELAMWRNDECRKGNDEKSDRIQKVLDRRKQKFGSRPPLPTICGC